MILVWQILAAVGALILAIVGARWYLGRRAASKRLASMANSAAKLATEETRSRTRADTNKAVSEARRAMSEAHETATEEVNRGSVSLIDRLRNLGAGKPRDPSPRP